MDCNRDEALRAKAVAERKFYSRDFKSARKFALKAQNLFPSLDGIAQMVATLDVYLASESKSNEESDWYSILSLNPFSDEETVKKQYRKLALQLHPDKNKSIGAEGAFKLISEAWSVLSDKSSKSLYDQKRSASQKRGEHNGYYTASDNRTSGARGRKSTSGGCQSAAAAAAARGPRLDTFWTSCNKCRMQYEYLRVYLNHNLLCPNCHQAFLAVEIGFPNTGANSSFSWSADQSQHNSSSTKHDYSFHKHEGNFDFCNATNSYAQTRKQEKAKAATLHSKNYVVNYGEGGIVSGQERTSSRVGRPPKRTKSIDGDAGRDEIEKRVSGAGKAILPDTEKPNGVSGENVKTRVSSRQSNLKEFAQISFRNMLMEKAKAVIGKKLEEWNVAAAAKLSDKQRSKGKRDEKANDNEKVADEQTRLFGSRTNANQVSTLRSKQIAIDVPDPDFHDFDKDRTERAFEGDQVWATYDNEDGMPRLYAMVQKVISLKPFKIRMSFLNSKTNIELGPINWVASGFSKTCGDFRVGRYEITETINMFSHRVRWEKGRRGVVRIVPKKGDTWALYRNWSSDWNELTPDDVIYKYEMVEVLEDFDEENGVTVTPLVKVAGFKTVFHRHMDPKEIRRIPKEELFRFSHQVPSHLLTGDEGRNAPKGCHELDPAATPVDLLKVITEVEEEVVMANAET